jgi:SAM-dependent methyltransferase
VNSLGSSVKVLLRPVTVPFRRLISFDKLKDIWGYVKGVNSAYKPFPGGLLKINNSTGGFLERLIEMASSSNSGGPWLLVSEPESAPEEIRLAWKSKHGVELPEIISLEQLLGFNWNSQAFQYDLCKEIALENNPKFSVILHQSLLEHVVDPVAVIKNLNQCLEPGGIQVIQTVNIYA